LQKNLKRIIKYCSSPINIQNGWQQILDLLEIADFYGIEFIFKAVIGQCYALSLEKIMYGYPKREKKSGLRTKIKSFHSGYSDQVVGIIGYPF